MSIETRTKLLFEHLGLSQIEVEQKSGISKQSWSKALNKRQRMNSEHIEFLCKEYPQFAQWLTTGEAEKNNHPSMAKSFAIFEAAAKKYSQAVGEFEYMLYVKSFFENDLDNMEYIESKAKNQEKYTTSPADYVNDKLKECSIQNKFGFIDTENNNRSNRYNGRYYRFSNMPLPSWRKTLQEAVYKDLVDKEFFDIFCKNVDANSEDINNEVKIFFFEKSIYKISEITNDDQFDCLVGYLKSSLFADFLIPVSYSN